MSEILKKVKLSRLYTNHSNRETAITAMDEAGIKARRIIVRASGRKNEASVRSYACHLNEPKKRQMSNILLLSSNFVTVVQQHRKGNVLKAQALTSCHNKFDHL